MRYLLVLAATLALAACTQTRLGDTTSDGGARWPGASTEDTGHRSAEHHGDGSGDGSGTATLQPCELLAGDDLAQLSLDSNGVEDEVAKQRGCLWTASGSHTVTVSIADEFGLEDVQSSTPTREMKVGSHDAVQSTGGISSCAINLGVTDTSRVDVISSANGDEAKACDIAKQAAALVEPRLPTG